MFVHKYDKRNAASIGNKAERLFVAIAGSRGYKVRPSNLNQNKINKVDFFLEKNSVIKGVDVKGQKKICAYDKDYSDEWTWVEFKNGDGFDGWLYGDSDYIAFEKKDYFIVVCRLSLVELCERMVDKSKDYASHCHQAKYRIYQRRDSEELSLIKTSDLHNLKRKKVWKKTY